MTARLIDWVVWWFFESRYLSFQNVQKTVEGQDQFPQIFRILFLGSCFRQCAEIPSRGFVEWHLSSVGRSTDIVGQQRARA